MPSLALMMRTGLLANESVCKILSCRLEWTIRTRTKRFVQVSRGRDLSRLTRLTQQIKSGKEKVQ